MDLEVVEQRLRNGESVRMIAKDLNTNHTTLSFALKKAGYHVPSREESAKNTWKNHKHPRLGLKGEKCPVYGKKMSAETRAKMQPIYDRMAKEKRMGRKKHMAGYIQVYAPDNPAADKGGYVFEHRYLMEKKIGRFLREDEVVHHINGNKADNRLENLQLMTRIDHIRLHAEERKKKHAQ